MSVAMAILSCASGSDTLIRHWPWFQKQEADRYHVILTEDTRCRAPDGVHTIVIGADKYLDGPHLPNRLLHTLERMLMDPWTHLVCAEYDCLFLRKIPVEEKVTTIAAHYAGAQTWSSKAKAFYHPPWNFSREYAMKFLAVGKQAIADGIPPNRESGCASTPEASPDVFVGYCVEQASIPVQTDLYSEFSRNSFDIPGDLEAARQAVRSGVDVVHGLKHEHELAYILS